VPSGTSRGVHQGEERDSHCEALAERCRNFVGKHFWAGGSSVSTVGRDGEVIRRYLQHQENEDRQQHQRRFS